MDPTPKTHCHQLEPMESKMVTFRTLSITSLLVGLILLLDGAVEEAQGFRLNPVGTEPTTLCNMGQDGLMACKPWVTTPSAAAAPAPAPPSAACCAALSAADLPCLCSYRNSMMLPALGIDPNLALQLPKKCNLVPPPQC